MKIERTTWSKTQGWDGTAEALADASWVLYFAAPEVTDGALFDALRARYPHAILHGCSTGGEIAGSEVLDGVASVIAVRFAATEMRGAVREIDTAEQSFDIGVALGNEIAGPELRALFVLSDGTRVNGTELTRGLRRAVGDHVSISGGLAGDGARFVTTRVGLDAPPAPGRISIVGLYGDSLVVRCGTAGGWTAFGPQRLVTKSVGNVLHELDGKPALDLYKKYLGEEAAALPASALLYPLVIRRTSENEKEPVVRTIVGVDEAANTMTFAGDIPEGAVAQLMRASLDELVEGANAAAQSARSDESEGFAVLVSCIGRKLLMGQRTADEVEVVTDVLGERFPTVGFYSYGEIAPGAVGFSDLHNQTMTITTFSERKAA